jgi:hypothetical protein
MDGLALPPERPTGPWRAARHNRPRGGRARRGGVRSVGRARGRRRALRPLAVRPVGYISARCGFTLRPLRADSIIAIVTSTMRSPSMPVAAGSRPVATACWKSSISAT